jgi:sulfatase modifying factor 1
VRNAMIHSLVFVVMLVLALLAMVIELHIRRPTAKIMRQEQTSPEVSTRPASCELKLVRIESGTFSMGSPLSEPGRDAGSVETLHTVTVTHPFLMGVTTITRSQFAMFANATGYTCSVEHGGRSIQWSYPGPRLTPGVTWRDTSGPADLFPVNRVSWEDAVAFCNWASTVRGRKVRLPTEAEWEYACRAGTITPFGGSGNLEDMGWYAGNSGDSSFDCQAVLLLGRRAILKAIADHNCALHAVGLKKPNAWGLYDMHGNVWEWCADAYADYSEDPAVDPAGPDIQKPEWRVMRGGQWSDIPETCRSANRGYFHPTDSIDTFGFRVVEEID